MYKNILLFCSVFFSVCFSYGQTENDSGKTEILLLGTLHFKQFHNKDSENTNFEGKKRQEEFEEVVTYLNKFNPDAVFIEREPSVQSKIDSLYQIENLTDLKDAQSEVYQIGFRLAKKNNLEKVFGVDHYESISQNLFNEGENLGIFKDSLKAFQHKGRTITQNFLKGSSTIREFLFELNRQENIEMSHRLFFNTPAYVTEGSFQNEERFSNVDNRFIGAEYISLFYNRNLKIYTNIINLADALQAKRIVLIIGQVHVGVLQELLRQNPRFMVVNTNDFLATQPTSE
ncbi:DUF5694 domain-containing protein [Flavobacteriaceae bacterium M23B6Z8]